MAHSSPEILRSSWNGEHSPGQNRKNPRRYHAGSLPGVLSVQWVERHSLVIHSFNCSPTHLSIYHIYTNPFIHHPLTYIYFFSHSCHIPLPTHPLIYCHPSIQLPIPPPIYNLIHSSLCPPAHPSVHPFTYPSILPLFIHSFFLTSLFPSSIHLSN